MNGIARFGRLSGDPANALKSPMVGVYVLTYLKRINRMADIGQGRGVLG